MEKIKNRLFSAFLCVQKMLYGTFNNVKKNCLFGLQMDPE